MSSLQTQMGLSENKVSQNQTKFYDHNFPIIFRVRIAIDLLTLTGFPGTPDTLHDVGGQGR